MQGKGEKIIEVVDWLQESLVALEVSTPKTQRPQRERNTYLVHVESS